MKISDKNQKLVLILLNILSTVINLIFIFNLLIGNSSYEIIEFLCKLIFPLFNITISIIFSYYLIKQRKIYSNFFSLLILSYLLSSLIQDLNQFAPILFLISFILIIMHYFIYKNKSSIFILIIIFIVILTTSNSISQDYNNENKEDIINTYEDENESLSLKDEIKNFLDDYLYSFNSIKVKNISNSTYTIYATYNLEKLELNDFVLKTEKSILDIINSDSIYNLYISNIIFEGKENNETKYFIDYQNFANLTISNLNTYTYILDKDKNVLNTNLKEEKNKYITSYKKSCEKFNYKTIFRYAEEYKGKKATFTGEIVQVINDGDNYSSYRVNITKSTYGYYNDTIFVEFYDNENLTPRLLVDDIITMYGTLNGLYTYESVLGSEITIPRMTAYYVDVNN